MSIVVLFPLSQNVMITVVTVVTYLNVGRSAQNIQYSVRNVTGFQTWQSVEQLLWI